MFGTAFFSGGGALPDMDIVSVIVPNHEYGHCFDAFFSALGSQTLGPGRLEVILVDDAGADDSLARAHDWAGRRPWARFEILALERRGRPGPVRNAGLTRARGRFLIALDPDDLIAPGHLESLVRALDAHPEASLAYTGCVETGDGPDRILPGQEWDPDLLRTQNIVTSSAMFRPKVWKASRGFAANTAYEDWDFWVQAAANGFSGVAVPEPLHVHRFHGGNYSLTARAEDGPAKALIVQNTPRFFHPKVRAWAGALLAGEPWAAPFPRGLIPRAEDVDRLLAVAREAVARCWPRAEERP